ncbi:MAG: WecB/TagA/CpsF family glycosyltransferase [Candidatus Moraniibacteriota bacterium]|nr:MAG: WecB/TagA/CpsF family glycosyltransferase [Candidatus Moranbacteria bacterium]
MDRICALGVTIQNTSIDEAKRFVENSLRSTEFHRIVTINPDFIMTAQRDNEFLDAINNADLSTIDGIGIYIPLLLRGKIPKGRVPGSDFMEYVLEISEHTNLSVFLLVNSCGLSTFQETKSAIKKKFPRLRVFGSDVSVNSPISIKTSLRKASNHSVVLSNFGGRLQEISLAQLQSIPGSTVCLAMGVGGAFDFLTGKQKRAPFIIRKFGLEWLWRLLLQPQRRLRRTWNYVFVYSLLCIKEALVHLILQIDPYVYHRKNSPIQNTAIHK